MEIDVTKRQNIKIGMLVEIVQTQHRESQERTRGFVQEIVSTTTTKRGILVKLTTGEEGNVKKLVTKEELKAENFKFWNLFFFAPKLYSIWDSENRRYVVIDHVNKNTGQLEKTALLFEDASQARTFMKGTRYDHKNFRVNELNRKKRIHENFKTLDIDCFRVNISRKITYSRLLELEEYFIKM